MKRLNVKKNKKKMGGEMIDPLAKDKIKIKFSDATLAKIPVFAQFNQVYDD